MVKRLVFAGLVGISSVWARHDIEVWSYKEAFSSEEFRARLGDKIKFYFGNTPHPKVLTSFGEFKSNKKTNAFAESDKRACQDALLKVLITLKARAYREGGNAVVGIGSYYKKNRLESDSTFECGAGAMAAGVALVGEVVKLEESPVAAPPDSMEAKPKKASEI